MIDFIARVLSIAFPAASFAILFSLAYWIYRQKTSSPQAKSSKLNFATYALVLSFTGISELIYHISGAIQAEIYKVWAIKYFYFLVPFAVIFLINAIDASTGNPPDNGSGEQPKKKPWESRGTFFLRIFALITAFTVFLPSAIPEDIPSLWYGSMYIVFGVSTTILLVASLQKVASILERKKVVYTVGGGRNDSGRNSISHHVSRVNHRSLTTFNYIYQLTGRISRRCNDLRRIRRKNSL